MQRCTLARWMTVVFVVLTAGVSLAWSHAKLLSQDEMYAFQTDRVPTWLSWCTCRSSGPSRSIRLLYHALSHAGDAGVWGGTVCAAASRRCWAFC